MKKAEQEMMVKGVIIAGLILYILLGIPNLTAKMLHNFDNIMVRVVIICLVVLSALYDPIICLLLAVGFILTHNQLQEVKNKESTRVIRNLQNRLNNNKASEAEAEAEAEEVVFAPIGDNKLEIGVAENEMVSEVSNDSMYVTANEMFANEMSANEMAANEMTANEMSANEMASMVSNELASMADNEMASMAENDSAYVTSNELSVPQLRLLIERDNVVNRSVADVNHFFELEDAMDSLGSNRVPMSNYNSVVSSVSDGYSVQGIDNRL
jgi:NhaP-type Na+/H+ and K+/H+ antiporter